MPQEKRIALITERLQAAFSPKQLEVIDDSEKHKGHIGSQGGAGHYTVIIESAMLARQTRVAAHREIYQVLQDLIPQEIHALKIKIVQEK